MHDRNQPSGHIPRLAQDSGFTLLELVVTIAVAAILMTIAIPSYRRVMQDNAMVSQVNDLVGDLNFARSEAITRGRPVQICPGNGGAGANARWLDGWFVYLPAASEHDCPAVPPSHGLLRVHGELKADIAFRGNRKIDDGLGFNAYGFTSENGSFTFTGTTPADVRLVCIALSGRIRTAAAKAGQQCADVS